MPAALQLGERDDFWRSGVLRWSLSIAVVATIHAVAITLISGASVPISPPKNIPSAVTIDLPAPPAPQSQAPVAPSPPQTEKQEPLEPAPAPAPLPPQPAPPETPQEQSAPSSTAKDETSLKLPDLPSMDWAKTVLAPPKLEEARRAAGPMTRSSWQRALVAHINRFQRYPPGASALGGAATVIFLISPSGQVLSVTLAASSGDPALDRETVAMIYRASPMPAPPGATENVTVAHTIHFQR